MSSQSSTFSETSRSTPASVWFAKQFRNSALWLIPAASLLAASSGQAWQFGVSASVQTSPAQIVVSWDRVPWGAENYTISRSTVIGGYVGGDGTWTAVASGISTTNVYVDTTVQVGVEYEYRVGRTGSQFDGDAYIDTGINLLLVEGRGKLILIVDNTYTTNATTNLNAELVQLQSDLVGDGWQVIRHDVSRTNVPADVRTLIQADYAADPNLVRSVLLVGRVPVLRSGDYAPDGHNSRPMPADTYYADMTGDWSSSPSYLVADTVLQVGRIDMYDMPSFAPLTDTDLTRQYLNRDHAWKFKQFTVAQRQAEMTTATGNAIQRQFFGTAVPTNIPNNYYPSNGYYSPEFWNEVQTDDYLWFTKGTGGGQYTACTGMGSTYHYAASPGVKTVFNTEFASWFVEWDVTDNFLRAPLAAKGYALVNAWSDCPAWVLHHMATGKTIGFATRLSQNNNSYYNIPGFTDLPAQHRGVHIALMGDPSLRMAIVAPAANFIATAGSGQVHLSWTASADTSVIGYALYRSTSANGPFTRLNPALATGTTYTDANVPNGGWTYMVRAVKLETSASGSYYNSSQGIFYNITTSGGVAVNQAPVVNAGNNQTVTLPAAATLAGSVIDDGLPNPPGITTSAWTVTSGPAPVVFGNLTSPATTATFSTPGTYVLRLTASDSLLTSFSEVTITVNPVRINHPPVASNQSINLNANSIQAVTLTATDADGDSLTYAIVSNPVNGTLGGTPPNVTYTPNANFTGPDSFTFKANDGIADSAPATISLSVNLVTNVSGSDVVAVFHLDNNLTDATGMHGNLTLANGATFDSSNLGWMSTPSGAALHFANLYDRASIVLPAADVNRNNQATNISVEAEIFVTSLVGHGVGSATLLELSEGWNSQLILNQDIWGTSPQMYGGNQIVFSASTLASSLTTGAWHHVVMSINAAGYSFFVDGNQIAQANSSDFANWSGTGNVTLQFGDINGWIDEVAVRSSSPTTGNNNNTNTIPPPPTLPSITVASSGFAYEAGPVSSAFAITRSGTNFSQPLTVNFSVSGSAVSGVNYTPIGSSVVIPAGAASVNAVVTPIHDGVFTGPLTLNLALGASANYQLGSAATASFTIMDADQPVLNVVSSTAAGATGGHSSTPPPTQVQLSASGAPGISYLLEYSTNLTSWSFLFTNTPGASLSFVDTIATNLPCRYYRTLYVPGSLSASNISFAAANAFYSADAVGYVNLTVAPGTTLIANPFNIASNTLSALFPNVPDKSEFFEFVNGVGYTDATGYVARRGGWFGANPTLSPGQGASFQNPTGTNAILTLVGTIPQGTLTTALPGGFSLVSPMTPVSTALGSLPGATGDQLYRWVNGAWAIYNYGSAGWNATNYPALNPGEAFFLYKAASANWVVRYSASN